MSFVTASAIFRAMKCPNCGAENQTGKYCASCGAGLDVTCPSCGADVPAGAAFCTVCGEPVAAEAEAGGAASKAPWLIAALSIVVVVALVMVFLPGETRTSRPADSQPLTGAPPGAGMGGGAGGAGPAMGGLSNDMRTNADRLFNRIMMAAEQGNEAEVAQFMPMAIQAYGMVDDLDGDGLFHLALLHLTAGSYDEAQQTADRILADNPDHLLGLAAAAQAAEAAGNTDEATGYWGRYLDAYDAEAGKPLPEYVDHQPLLSEYRDMARAATGRQ
ncbi:MAG: zinc-ribbon domain-containing protein [Candidatus Longimicrobiales bacterium M2_2A_002]